MCVAVSPNVEKQFRNRNSSVVNISVQTIYYFQHEILDEGKLFLAVDLLLLRIPL